MLRSTFIDLLKDESGDEIVEYALVAAVFSLGVALAITALITGAGTLTNSNESNFSNGMVNPP